MPSSVPAGASAPASRCPVHGCAASTGYVKRKCRCEVCRGWQRERRRERRRENKEAGFCRISRSHGPAAEGATHCAACLERLRERVREQKRKNKEAGFCRNAQSHGPAAEGATYCAACLEQQRERWATDPALRFRMMQYQTLYYTRNRVKRADELREKLDAELQLQR